MKLSQMCLGFYSLFSLSDSFRDAQGHFPGKQEKETTPVTLSLIPIRVFTGSGVQASPDESAQEGLWKAVQIKKACSA